MSATFVDAGEAVSRQCLARTKQAGFFSILLEGDANAHLKLIGHHALAQRLDQQVLLWKGGRRSQGSIPFRHKAAAKPCANIGDKRLLAELQPSTQDRSLSNNVLASIVHSRRLRQ